MVALFECASDAFNTHGKPLPDTRSIVIVAPDPALLRSMAFALQAHGYAVEQYRSWVAAGAAAGRASCLVIDDCLPATDLQAGLAHLARGTAVVLLAEDDTAYGQRPGLQVLYKPLSGADLVAALAVLRRIP
jgi:DNA-binding response OmpR family regulator